MILLDIEGTTTPIAFVTDTLVPYARAHLRRYLEIHGNSADGARVIARLQAEHAAERTADAPAWSAEAYARWLMDRDRKSSALKDLQGRIWEEGYAGGALTGPVFEDVPRALARWRASGTPVGIFSSGSVLAQQWLFRRSSAGDLTRYLTWHFDTAVGPKQQPASYARIAESVHLPAPAITFVSDVLGELDAARTAGMATRLCIRPDNPPQPAHHHPIITTFDQLPPQ
jgi:enolase-phosphatase E1